MTNYFFRNTDAGSLIVAPRPRYHVLITRYLAATGGPRSFGEQLGYTPRGAVKRIVRHRAELELMLRQYSYTGATPCRRKAR